LRALESRLLRRIVGGKSGVRGHRKIMTKLIALLFILLAVKAERMTSAGRRMRSEQTGLVGNLEKKKQFGKPSCK
jgi:hypothetical protein